MCSEEGLPGGCVKLIAQVHNADFLYPGPANEPAYKYIESVLVFIRPGFEKTGIL
jgi:hypothetical protein